MFKKVLLFTLTLGIAYTTFTSSSGGYAASGNNRTGAAGSSASCGTCHGSSTANTACSLVVVDKAAPTVPVTKYTPLKTYTVTLAGTNTAGLAKFGFQVACTNGSSVSTGTITATSTTNTAVRTVSGIKIIEHTTAIPGVVAGVYSISFDWVAPAKGTGNATFYGILNAVNGNGGDDAGDDPSFGITKVLTEEVSSAINEQNTNLMSKIYPNPATNVLNIEGLNGEYAISVSDLVGRVLLNTQSQSSIDVSSLAPGIYNLRIVKGSEQQTSTFVKQ